MNPVRVLLRAYYERLHERMEAQRAELIARIGMLLPAEIEARRFGPLRPDQVQAYHEACVAFIDERLETYNPIGIQYTFDHATSRGAAELEFQLDWYTSRAEFESLVSVARALVDQDGLSDENLSALVDELIRRVGAYPDRSILAGYAEKPTLQKLPDFLVASAIEAVVCDRSMNGR